MRRLAMATAAAFCVGGGFVLGEFVRGVRPVGYLARPLLAIAVLAIVVGIVGALFREWAVVAAVFAMAWIVQPESTIALVIAGITAGLVAYRLWKHRTPNMDGALLAAAVVFLVAGLVPVVPMMSWSTPARADVPSDGPPQYVILLDGYPRADTLAAHGFDISPFIADLEERAFDHYPEATSRFPTTLETLSVMTAGEAVETDTVAEQRAVRDNLSLPDGWVTIAPPTGFVTFPDAPVLNPGGFTVFDAGLLGRSLLPAREVALAGYRNELARSFQILASTEERRVFAHIFAPHLPALYDADGYPVSGIPVTVGPRPHNLTEKERIDLIGGYTQWLNGQLIDVVDRILDRHPDAAIVLFSDHGGRYDRDDIEEWHRVFLASRTPDRPDLFSDSPHPGDVLRLLDARHPVP